MTLIENVTVDVDVEETAGVTKQQDMHQIQTFIFIPHFLYVSVVTQKQQGRLLLPVQN